ncbi:hypothetical protein PHAVU_001G132900 [Phaseolus vulgaris]|uniref:Uncharacterized protein n=1 Tax=Phaseolus vulgaris TaxID=3885 RepID=V7CXW6_PHAVU|nr:hypothetical protein PHAVU_001G132900g [Phaseolus vulgaris]ESW34198.1 hypothetical protein PHAVU_001G132900g [Phaseolus vulgaris]
MGITHISPLHKSVINLNPLKTKLVSISCYLIKSTPNIFENLFSQVLALKSIQHIFNIEADVSNLPEPFLQPMVLFLLLLSI